MYRCVQSVGIRIGVGIKEFRIVQYCGIQYSTIPNQINSDVVLCRTVLWGVGEYCIVSHRMVYYGMVRYGVFWYARV